MELNETPNMLRDVYTILVGAERSIEQQKTKYFSLAGSEHVGRYMQNALFAVGSAMHHTLYAYEQAKMAVEKQEYKYTAGKEPNGSLHITKEMIESIGYDVVKDDGQFLEATSRFPRNKMKIWLNREGNYFGIRNDFDTRDSFNGRVKTWEQVVAIVDCVY